MPYSVLLSMLHAWSMSEDLRGIRIELLKTALVVSWGSETNARRKNNTRRNVRQFLNLACCFHIYNWSTKENPQGINTLWFESCPIFDWAAFKCIQSSCATGQAAAPLTPPACVPSSHSLGQVSYYQECSLNNQLYMCVHTCVRIHTHACQFAHTQGASHPLPCLSAKRGINTAPSTASSHVMEGKMGGEGKGSTNEYVDGRRGAERLRKRDVLVSVELGGKGLRNRGK